ncbi:MAG: hypothetical protein QF893_09810, partial [Alphaproteobacteria bacterium]|nr:hypothetical protein [Alphaproteobacteria bacterium]
MPVGPIHVYDTSLRDGLRNSGIAIALDDKVRFARQLDRLNVSAIEVGFGGPTQVETMTRLAGAVEKAAVFGLSRVNRRDVDRVLGSVAAAKHPGINVFSPASPRFLEHVGQTPTAALTASLKAVAHAKPHVAQLVFTAQDAVQAER